MALPGNGDSYRKVTPESAPPQAGTPAGGLSGKVDPRKCAPVPPTPIVWVPLARAHSERDVLQQCQPLAGIPLPTFAGGGACLERKLPLGGHKERPW